jgi:hypothetical protein
MELCLFILFVFFCGSWLMGWANSECFFIYPGGHSLVLSLFFFIVVVDFLVMFDYLSYFNFLKLLYVLLLNKV